MKASPDREESAMNHVRGRAGRVAWILAAVLTMGSFAPAIAGQMTPPGMGALTPGPDPSDQTDVETSPPAPTPTPSPEPTPTPTPTPSPEPSPTPTQTPEPSPPPTPEPSPHSTPPGPKPTRAPTSSVDGGSVDPIGSPASFDPPPQEHHVGLEESSDTESLQQHAGVAGRTSSFIESVTSILDQLASVDAPVGGPQLPCHTSVCGSPLDLTRSTALALASICIVLAVAGAFGVWARGRRSSDDSSAEDA
jgi:outer membrane biosynthesis protein TonB